MIGLLINDRYRLIAPLGEGGMATLWRAVDEQLDREVAVKILREQYGSDPGFAARFRQEARAAGSLAHPNIVPVYDYGTDSETGNQFIVMQLVEGQDLAAILRERGTLSTDDAVRVALGVASALEAAHRRGIVHRDVKPGNILITDDGEVKVTDFGIARAVSETSMTVTGTTLGSVHYFSPEQARGDEVTGRSDVYALGIVLYEMLTGRRPFEGDSAAGVALKRLTEDPPPPSTLRPVPSGLEAIVMRALQREPQDRFPDAGSMAEALRAWQRDPAAAAAAAATVGATPRPPAPLPPSGEPTMYVPPPVARPSDRIPAAAAPPIRRPPPRYEERAGTPWWMWLLVVLAVVLLGTIGFLGAQILGNLGPDSTPSQSAEQVEVPDWVGDPIAAVRDEADDLNLRLREEEQPSDEVEEGRVISTDPEAGTPVAEGSTVTVVVSTGPEEVEVPNVIGQTEDQARQTLQNAGLEVGRVDFENSDQPEGRVIRTEPAAGVTLNAGDQVNLVISRGPTPSPSPSPTPEPTLPPTPEPTLPPTPPPTPTPTPTSTEGGGG
ncbi:MAG TPA: Stk1 family PASTA domain-containing Ser/Thr kinase [candidate division Zixibacteria bacterium]|nr:Stk1 family PASTA domain-containing Ser/Thr kinase [candidate division Zixibacteria bacterium]